MHCVVCSKMFDAGREWSRYCGNRCRQRAKDARRRGSLATGKLPPISAEMSYDVIGAALGISGETVRNIEARALRKLLRNAVIREIRSCT